ncbi:nitroreductase family protein [Phocaeicola paurosaccharolyticus]|jgi:nitroreductase|uniref:nitroreductase family protein n=1 Tax=Phocaeicola paurosaccharolyticus TaxID=732242 RepID=UPI00046AE5FA|nr:nitroreductase family protein [Phocaeicola paurosaccharolyticus]
MNFLELVKSRYSSRKYSDKIPEKEKLHYIMECVRYAPSAVNFQPWLFKIITDKKELESLHSCYKREWIKSAPCIIVACANHEESWHRKSDDKDHSDIDVAIAVEHLCLAATEQGLASCWVCNFDVTLCREVLSLPSEVEPVVLVPIGYAEDEASEKKRKSIDEITL